MTALERERLTQIEHRLAASPQRVHDTRLQHYLERLLGRLDGGPPVRLYVLQGAAAQAELLGGEVLQVRTGLLAAVGDEDELAFVLAHELAHRRLGHVAARRDPRWDALQAELEADRAAAASIIALGYRASAGRTLLERLARSSRPPGAGLLIQPRIDALPQPPPASGPAPSVAFTEALRPYRRAENPR